MKLKDKLVINGKIKILTGLHIGVGKEGFQIGAVDAPVIKLREGLPYIPGSSLKGKLRALLEKEKGDIKVIINYKTNDNKILKREENYKDITQKDLNDIPDEYKKVGAKEISNITATVCKCGNCDICILFGSGETKTTNRLSVLIFRDAYLTDESKSKFKSKKPYEVKAENRIDRIKGTASDPRFIERIIPGVEFDVEIIANLLNNGTFWA